MSSPLASRAFREKVNQRLNNRAEATGQLKNRLQRQFVMTRFLARVFGADPDGWVLKGGTGMMIRLPEARYSQDVDLIFTAPTSIDEVVDGLQVLLRANPIDLFVYTISRREHKPDGKMTVRVGVALGTTEIDSFKIDLRSHRGVIGAIETHAIPQIIDLGDDVPTGAVRVYPLADQIADKLCAMYEFHLRHGQPPPGENSNRYRDLVDLLLIGQSLPIDLETTVAALENQRIVRDQMTLPMELHTPGPDWYENWSEYAADSPLDDTLYNLDAALALAAG